jgi:hypothetical protein
MTDKLPIGEIIYKDENRLNNRWDNLELSITHRVGQKQRQKISKTLTGTKHAPEWFAKMKGRPCQYPRRWFYHRGFAFRSNWEKLAAIKFDELGIRWEYESYRFDLGSHTYAPDFYLPDQECFWEIKGYFGPKSRKTINLFRERFPDIDLVVANEQVLKTLGITRNELINPTDNRRLSNGRGCMDLIRGP